MLFIVIVFFNCTTEDTEFSVLPQITQINTDFIDPSVIICVICGVSFTIVWCLIHHRENKVTFFSSVKLCVLCGEHNSKVVPKPAVPDNLQVSKNAGVRK